MIRIGVIGCGYWGPNFVRNFVRRGAAQPVGGSRSMVVCDDLEASEKIKVYDRGISVKPDSEDLYQMRIGYRSGDMSAPHLGVGEALQVEAQHFVDCVTSGDTPVTEGAAVLRVVRLLEAANASKAAQGRLVSLSASPR